MLSFRRVRRVSPALLGVLGASLVLYVVVAALQRREHLDAHGYLIGAPAPPLAWLDPPVAFLLAVALGLAGALLATLQVYQGAHAPHVGTGAAARRTWRGAGALDLATLWLCAGLLVCCMLLGAFSVGPFLAPVTLSVVIAAGIVSRHRYSGGARR